MEQLKQLADQFSAPVSLVPLLPILMGLYVFVMAVIIGYLVITRVPPLLHTPLMSATNAISGISLVASMVIAGSPDKTVEIAGVKTLSYFTLSHILGGLAVTVATINVVGGFLITDRMLRMFKKKEGK